VPGPLREARPDTPVGDLPLDSLDFVELLCAIEEEFGVRLTEVEFQGARSVADLAATIAGHTS
jgi:acyl carrier protein